MKTLKQVLRKGRTNHYHRYGDTIPYNPIDGVREWLQQKLNAMPAGEWGEKSMLLELLEELE